MSRRGTRSGNDQCCVFSRYSLGLRWKSAAGRDLTYSKVRLSNGGSLGHVLDNFFTDRPAP